MQNKTVSWQLTLPDGNKVGGSLRLSLPQDWEKVAAYFQEISAEMTDKTLEQRR